MPGNMFSVVDNEARNDVINNKRQVNVERSVFPYGRSAILPMNEGYIYPVDCFMTLPGDSIDIDYATYLESLNPFVDRQYSGMKLSIHVFYNKCEHEWRGWKAFATRGIRGNISLTLPYISPSVNAPVIVCDGYLLKSTAATNPPIQVYLSTPHSLSNYLVGLHNHHITNQPISSSIESSSVARAQAFGLGDNTQVNRSFYVSGETVVGSGTSTSFCAIPFSQYQRTFRKFYLNQNLVKDNKNWFPDDDDDFVLPYSGGVVSVLNVNSASRFGYPYSLVPNNYSEQFNLNTDTPDYTKQYADAPWLAALRCRQWSGDPFTTSVPFLERAGTTSLYTSTVKAFESNGLPFHNGDLTQGLHDRSDTANTSQILSYNFDGTNLTPFYSLLTNSNGSPCVGNFLTLNNLRELSAATLWSERNAKARGDYNSLIEAHYSRDPDSEDREPIYLGGSVQRVNFDSIVSQSETTNQPLGTRTSVASSGGRSSIRHFECPDFGYIQILASLVPDTFYTQGIREEFDPTTLGSDLPWPEFANLQKENVLLKRIYASGNASQDSRLVGFNERFLNWKYRLNVLLGNFNDHLDSKFRSMSFARYFDSTSISNMYSINNEFVTCSPYNCRSDMYTVPSQPHFTLQFGDNVRIVRALPFASRESALTNIA